MESAKNFAKLLANKVTTGQMIDKDLAEDAVYTAIKFTKPVVVILAGPTGMGKSKIHKSTFLPNTHRHLLDKDNFTSIFKTMLWYDFLYFKRHIHSLDGIIRNSDKLSCSSMQLNDRFTFINRTLFDTVTYRTLIILEAYTCEPIAFRNRVDNLLSDEKIHEILNTIRQDLQYTLHYVKFDFDLKFIWILSKTPENCVTNLKNRIFYQTTAINWTRFCINQMYLFEKLVRLLDVGDIIYTNPSITVEIIQKHIADSSSESDVF